MSKWNSTNESLRHEVTYKDDSIEGKEEKEKGAAVSTLYLYISIVRRERDSGRIGQGTTHVDRPLHKVLPSNVDFCHKFYVFIH